MYILKKINKCIYTGTKYHILFHCENNINQDILYKIKAVDEYFDKDDWLRTKKIIGFCNIHKVRNITRYNEEDNTETRINKLIYHPSSVYIRDDMRNKGIGYNLYLNMLKCIKLIHGNNKIKKPLFLQHEQAEEWAKTDEFAKRIYSKLLKDDYVHQYKEKKEVKDGWYKLNFDNSIYKNQEIILLKD